MHAVVFALMLPFAAITASAQSDTNMVMSSRTVVNVVPETSPALAQTNKSIRISSLLSTIHGELSIRQPNQVRLGHLPPVEDGLVQMDCTWLHVAVVKPISEATSTIQLKADSGSLAGSEFFKAINPVPVMNMSRSNSMNGFSPLKPTERLLILNGADKPCFYGLSGEWLGSFIGHMATLPVTDQANPELALGQSTAVLRWRPKSMRFFKTDAPNLASQMAHRLRTGPDNSHQPASDNKLLERGHVSNVNRSVNRLRSQSYQTKSPNVGFKRANDSVEGKGLTNKFIVLQQKQVKNEPQVNQMAGLRAEQHIRALMIALVVVIILLTGVLMAFLGSEGRSTLRYKQALQEDNERMNARLELTEVDLQYQLDLKNKELTSQTLHLIQKNQLLVDIKNELVAILEDEKREPRKQLGQLLNKVGRCFNQDKDWNCFRTTFDQLHPDFFSHLTYQFPDLTAADLRLLALLKVNMSSVEIAGVLTISTDSLRVARYRLRKKLGLDEAESLTSFVHRFPVPVNHPPRAKTSSLRLSTSQLPIVQTFINSRQPNGLTKTGYAVG